MPPEHIAQLPPHEAAKLTGLQRELRQIFDEQGYQAYLRALVARATEKFRPMRPPLADPEVFDRWVDLSCRDSDRVAYIIGRAGVPPSHIPDIVLADPGPLAVAFAALRAGDNDTARRVMDAYESLGLRWDGPPQSRH